MNHHKVKDVDYGTFLTMVDKKEVSKVELNGDTIYFTDKAAEPNYYETTTFEDPDLVTAWKKPDVNSEELHRKR